jgi:hypothetical protein
MCSQSAIKHTLEIDQNLILIFDVDVLAGERKCVETGARLSVVYNDLGYTRAFDPDLAEAHSIVFEKIC